ncbi:hypothetical protein [Candidatus Tisiphia endosymbiont of Dioctria rufipes]|uniref:hypothetical protein n=1 Tax=Candidatus Tisiphia endosymbiont of Dioctria rufipes TaxID=3066255 RepID=UPI00312CBDBB
MTPISNRRATSDDVTNFSSIDYKMQTLHRIKSREQEKRIALDTLHDFIPLARLARVTRIEQELYALASKILEEI